MTPLEIVLSHLPDAKPNGRGWTAPCPAHDDRHPSLSIAEGEDGRALVKCHAGCATTDVVAALGLTMADLMPADAVDVDRTPRKRPKRKVASTSTPVTVFPAAYEAVAVLERRHGPRADLWTYHNAEGEPIGVIIRWNLDEIDPKTGKPQKDIRPVSRNDDGWYIGAMPPPRPLYSLPELAAAKRVFICEGEPAADAVRSLGLTATTSSGGSNSAHQTDWTALAGKEAVILPDHDPSGSGYTDDVKAILAKLPAVPVVKMVELPGLPPKGDAVEYIAARRTAGLSDPAIAAEVEALADAAVPLTVQSRPAAERSEPFPTDALPEPLRGFVSAGTKAIGCDASYIALPLLSALAAAIGNARQIELKLGWTEPSVIWTAIVGESGAMKSPGQDLALRAVRRKQQDAMATYREAMERYRRDMVTHNRAMAQWKRAEDQAEPPERPAEPVMDRYWCADTTVEGLAPLLRDQPRGLLMVRDEFSGWLNSFGHYTGSKGADVANWLEMHRAQPLMIDRKTSDMIYVPRAAVSVTGCIPPGTLRQALGREHRENGLAARLLLALPPKRRKRWTEAAVPARVEAGVRSVFDELYGVHLGSDSHGDPCPLTIKLTPEARQVWINFYNTHAAEQFELTGDLSAAWSKLEGYAARLALVVHCVRLAAKDSSLVDPRAVDEDSIASAVALVRWFKREARRVYAMLAESKQDREGRPLIEIIWAKGGKITARELARSSRKHQPIAKAEAALEQLSLAGIGRWEDVPVGPQGGRPTRRLKLLSDVDVAKTPQHQRNK